MQKEKQVKEEKLDAGREEGGGAEKQKTKKKEAHRLKIHGF